MTTELIFAPPRLLSAKDKVGKFDCGDGSLNTFLRNQSKKNQREDYSRIWVVTHLETGNIVGYYAVANGSVGRDAMPDAKSPPKEIPVFILGRLAVDLSFKRRGLGKNLLLDALQKCRQANEFVAGKAVLLHVLKDNYLAISLYESFGFVSVGDSGESEENYLTMLRYLD